MSSIALGSPGLFGSAIAFDGTSEAEFPASLVNTALGSLSMWIHPARTFVTRIYFYAAAAAGPGFGANEFHIHGIDGTVGVHIGGGSGVSLTSTVLVDEGWHHVAVTWTASGDGILYVDGRVDQSTPHGGGAFVADAVTLIGNTGAPSGREFVGSIDELGIWSRVLDPAEVAQIYRRGGNRISLQFRSCDDSACSTESWRGPNNTAAHDDTFSELNNCSGLNATSWLCDFGAGEGVATASPHLSFADFSALTLDSNRYFQYRIYMESSDRAGTPTFPSLSSLRLGPERFPSDSPDAASLVGPQFQSWTGFSDSVSGGCSVTYQVSIDRATWYYHDGARWEVATTPAQSNTGSELDAAASAFAAEVGTGTLYFTAFFNSDGSQSCSLNEVSAVVES